MDYAGRETLRRRENFKRTDDDAELYHFVSSSLGSIRGHCLRMAAVRAPAAAFGGDAGLILPPRSIQRVPPPDSLLRALCIILGRNAYLNKMR